MSVSIVLTPGNAPVLVSTTLLGSLGTQSSFQLVARGDGFFDLIRSDLLSTGTTSVRHYKVRFNTKLDGSRYYGYAFQNPAVALGFVSANSVSQLFQLTLFGQTLDPSSSALVDAWSVP